MDILIPDEWLRNFLNSPVTPKKLAEYLSLCGPTVDRVERQGKTDVYHIEVTTNRVDAASVYGVAREASAILPRFGIKASLAKANYKTKLNFTRKVNYLDAQVDSRLCPRFSAILVRGVTVKESPDWMKERLTWVGIRPINNVVDVSNYIMTELGQPVHTFDYDKIRNAKMILRESKRGEKIITLDGKTHTLHGGDIVIEDGEGRLIDLAGIMGGENSQVDKDTKNVLLFVQTYNPVNIRKTTMALAHRSEASTLFEKGLDTENVTLGIGRGVELLEKVTSGKAERNGLDLYPKPYEGKKLSTTLDFINSRLGKELEKKEISLYLTSLDFTPTWSGEKLSVEIPSFRAKDMNIEEDIVEEVARIYGYHNLPSTLMGGRIPDSSFDSPFVFEKKVKDVLKGWGGVEVYTYSLVPKSFVSTNAIKLKNPLGKDSEYLRISLLPSLKEALNKNSGERDPFYLFEMAKVYIPRKNDLPNEEVKLSVIFSNYKYRDAKGILEALLETLNINFVLKEEEAPYFKPGRHLEVKVGNSILGHFGELEGGNFYLDFSLEALRNSHKETVSYKSIPKYPAQIEDLTLTLPEKTRVGEVLETIATSDKDISKVYLHDTFKDSYTFRVRYQSPVKTLTDKEVESIREKILKSLEKKFGVMLRS